MEIGCAALYPITRYGFPYSFDNYLKEVNKNIDEIKKDWKTQAEKRVRTAICLKEIADKENIEVSDEEVTERVNQHLKRYPDIKEVEKNIDLESLKEYTKEVLRNEKVLGLIEKEAEIS